MKLKIKKSSNRRQINRIVKAPAWVPLPPKGFRYIGKL